MEQVRTVGGVRIVIAGETSFLVRCSGDGDGAPVLLLHGVPETSACWRDVSPGLAEGRRVLAPDLPGLGGSRYSGPYDVGSLVAQLIALLDAEGIEQVDVVGHDWGGILAFGLAARHPDRVRRLVAANAPYHRSAPLWRSWYVMVFALPGLPDTMFRVAGRRVVETMLRLGWGDGPPLDAERREEYAAAYTSPSAVRAVLGYYRSIARPRRGALRPGSGLATAVGDVRVPGTFLLWGADDPALPISVAEDAVVRLGSDTTLTTIPGAGHFVIEERPELVTELVRSALA